jgi:hypothetical protein
MGNIAGMFGYKKKKVRFPAEGINYEQYFLVHKLIALY